MSRLFTGVAVAVAAFAGQAYANPELQFDVNSLKLQVQNGSGQNSGFGGLNHTGSINFSMAASTNLGGLFINGVNAGFSGSLFNYIGTIDLDHGHVTGGHLAIVVNGGADAYSCDIVSGIGMVESLASGGFTVDGLSFNGLFTDDHFGNVDVSPWFNSQSGAGGLPGSFLQFNFDPNASGTGFADMDMFVSAADNIVPIPPAAWTGFATLAGMMTVGYIRRRRRQSDAFAS